MQDDMKGLDDYIMGIHDKEAPFNRPDVEPEEDAEEDDDFEICNPCRLQYRDCGDCLGLL